MDSFEFNKFAGAILFTLLVTLGVGILAEELFTPHHPEKPGYEVALADGDGPGMAEADSVEMVELPVLLAAAEVSAGEGQTKKCLACHTFDQGGAAKVGPNLWNIVGRTMGTQADYAKYSASMKEHGAEGDMWTYDNLDAFLAAPKKYMDGTAMAFAGIRKPADRADLIVYLRTLSDDPMDLPEAGAAQGGDDDEAAMTDEAPAEDGGDSHSTQ